MSKKGKKGSNKRGKNPPKSSKPSNAKQPRMETPSDRVHDIQLPGTSNISPVKTGTEAPMQFTHALRSENMARAIPPGDSILARCLAADPSIPIRDVIAGVTMARDSGAGPSASPRDMGAGPSVSPRDVGAGSCPEPEDSEVGPIDLSMNSGAGQMELTEDQEEGPINLSRDSGTGPSSYSRDSGAGPSTESPYTGTGPSTEPTYYAETDPNTEEMYSRPGPSAETIYLEAGPSAELIYPGAGPSAEVIYHEAGLSAAPVYHEAGPSSEPIYHEAGPSSEQIYYEAGPSAEPIYHEAGPSSEAIYYAAGPSTVPMCCSRAGPSTEYVYPGAGPSTAPNTEMVSSLDTDKNLPGKIIVSFLGVPKSMQDDDVNEKLERLTKALTLQHYTSEPQVPVVKQENGKKDDDANSAPKSECSFKIPASRLKRKIPSDEPQPSTSKDDKDDNQVSSTLLDKPNGDQISQISSSISEKRWARAARGGQETVVSPREVETLADSVQRCEISTTDMTLGVRHVQDIESEILQMDIVRESNNSNDFGSQYIQRLAANLLEGEGPIVKDDYRPAVWPKNKSRVPHVFLHPPFEFRNHMRNALARNIQFYHPKRGTHYTKILGPSLEDQRKLTQYFDEHQMSYHTFGDPSDKMCRVVIRGLSGDIDLEKIKEAMISASIPIVRLEKMRYNGMHKKNWHIILAIVPHSAEGLQLLNVMKIFGQDVTMERAKPTTMQCHRCQRWGHVQRHCHGRVKCVKCAGDHFSKECTRDPEEEPLKCANCGGDHAANYRECCHCPDSAVYKRWQKSKTIRRHKFPKVLATSENFDMFYARDGVGDARDPVDNVRYQLDEIHNPVRHDQDRLDEIPVPVDDVSDDVRNIPLPEDGVHDRVDDVPVQVDDIPVPVDDASDQAGDVRDAVDDIAKD